MPWKIAHKTDLLTYQEITMARAVPNVMPVLIVSNLYDIFISLAISICPLFHYKAILCSVQKRIRPGRIILYSVMTFLVVHSGDFSSFVLAFSDLVVIFSAM